MASQTQSFMGDVVPKIVGDLLGSFIRSPQIPVERSDVAAVKPAVERAVTDAVREEMLPRIQHLTNQEPWYQSRVTWGSLISIVAGILGIVGYAEWDERQQAERVEQIMALIPVIAPIIGGVWSLIGRWFSTKPLGAGIGARNGGA